MGHVGGPVRPAHGRSRPAAPLHAVRRRHRADPGAARRDTTGWASRSSFAPFDIPGRRLVAGEAIPLNVLRFIAAQLGMRADSGLSVRFCPLPESTPPPSYLRRQQEPPGRAKSGRLPRRVLPLAVSSQNTRRIWNREVQRLVAGKHSQRRLYPTADSLSVRSIVTHGPQYLDLYRSSDSALSYCVRFCSNSFQLCYSMVEQTVSSYRRYCGGQRGLNNLAHHSDCLASGFRCRR